MVQPSSATIARGNPLQLTLATGAFAVCFAAFGSVAAMMPLLQRMGLSPLQISVGLAIPVLLGSVGRIPLGMLADRFGGKRVFLAVMGASALAAVLMGFAASFTALVGFGFFLGIALASFSVGVSFVSRWYPPARQGAALGIYGAGNAGQSIAAFGAPLLAAAAGLAWGFWTFAALAAAWLALFAVFGRDATPPAISKSLREVMRPLSDGRSWRLSLYYFLTFGGFVAMAVYLPTLLTDTFHLAPADAGLRTAGFVALATLARPIGGALADRIGGRTILLGVFPAVAFAAVFLATRSLPAFTFGALGVATAIGLGNGAVFKLVPEYFPKDVGSVTGLVGAAGGLGGFFPPLILGAIRQATGGFSAGFLCLSAFAVGCFLVIFTRGGADALPEAHGAHR